jgi:uncharacterized protein YkwD
MLPSTLRMYALASVVCVCLGGFCLADAKDKSEFKLSEDEQAIVDLTNKARADKKLPVLKPNEALCKAARAHSANMARQQKMEHVLDDKNPSDRVKAAGYRSSFVGENIAAGNGWSLEQVFQVWMDSELHKKNILTKEYKEIGVGIARDSQNKLYYTQVFGTSRKRK